MFFFPVVLLAVGWSIFGWCSDDCSKLLLHRASNAQQTWKFRSSEGLKAKKGQKENVENACASKANSTRLENACKMVKIPTRCVLCCFLSLPLLALFDRAELRFSLMLLIMPHYSTSAVPEQLSARRCNVSQGLSSNFFPTFLTSPALCCRIDVVVVRSWAHKVIILNFSAAPPQRVAACAYM